MTRGAPSDSTRPTWRRRRRRSAAPARAALGRPGVNPRTSTEVTEAPPCAHGRGRRGGDQGQRERNRRPTAALGERGACEGAQRKTRDERRQCGGEGIERGANDKSQHARPDHLVRERREACKRQHCRCKSVSMSLGVPTIDVCRGETGFRPRAIVPGILWIEARLRCRVLRLSDSEVGAGRRRVRARCSRHSPPCPSTSCS